MENFQETIGRLRAEFVRHETATPEVRFQPSLETSSALAMLTRDLETKRQLGHLTVEEKTTLVEIGTLWQDIARFNNQAKIQKASPVSVPIYSLAEHKLVEPHQPAPVPPEIPSITHEQANEIITGLNRQFEEKVMSRRSATLPYSPAVGAGRNLQDYISHLQSQKSSLPFAGEESHIDLDVLRSRAKN